MVWHLRKPTHATIHSYLASLTGVEVNYPNPGISRGACPPGYRKNYLSHQLGHGRECFARACRGLMTWAMVRDLGWLTLCRPAPAVAIGQVVATLARPGGLWALNPCKIVYQQLAGDNPNAPNTAEFGYVTLPGHVFFGEERFSVRFDPKTEAVTYELCAYTKPATWLTAVGRPYATLFQKRFARESAASLARFCQTPSQ